MWFSELASSSNPGTQELQAFIVNTVGFLGFVVENREEFPFLWENDPDLHSLAVGTFYEDVRPLAKRLHDAIPDIPIAAIENHGLAGRPLAFKLKALNAIADLWEKVRGQTTVRGWLKQVFDLIDSLLDSIIEAAGAVGAILKEFKDTLSGLIQEAQ